MSQVGAGLLLLLVAACGTPARGGLPPVSTAPPSSDRSPAADTPPATPTAPGTPSSEAGESAAPTPGTAAKPVTLAFGGDVHFQGASRDRLLSDPRTALGPIKRVLSRADLAMVNLETAVTTKGTPAPKAYRFRAPATAFVALRGAGIDIATMANNHTLDYGQVGLRDSLSAARKYDFPVVGLGADEDKAYAAHRFTVRGQRISIVGVTNVIDGILIPSWTAGPSQGGVASAKRRDRLRQAVVDARKDSDTVVVYLHWGAEGADCPTDEQRILERLLVEAGADVIVGTHAHLLLGGGWHRRGPYVDYGLGNFAFYSTSGPGTETGVLWLDVLGHKVTGARWIPARINGGIPIRQSGSDGERILASKNRARECTDLLTRPPG